MDNSHENITYSNFRGIFPDYRASALNEERGRIPNIQKNLDELTAWALSKVGQKNIFYATELIFTPQEESFFSEIKFYYPCIRLKDDEQETYMCCFYPDSITWNREGKISFALGLSFDCKKKNFEKYFRINLAHELLHAYEAFKKGEKNLPFETDSSNSVYEKITQAYFSKKEPQATMAFILYLGTPNELRAAAQEIQIASMDLYRQGRIVSMYNLPFGHYRQQIEKFKNIVSAKKKLNRLFETWPSQEMIEAGKNLTGKDFASVEDVRKYLNNIILTIEQTYEKALSRGIEACRSSEQRMEINFNKKALEEGGILYEAGKKAKEISKTYC